MRPRGGHREHRLVELPGGGFATASVELKTFGSRRSVYAYLRYQIGPRTKSTYLGEVRSATRLQALKNGWRLARERGLLKIE